MLTFPLIKLYLSLILYKTIISEHLISKYFKKKIKLYFYLLSQDSLVLLNKEFIKIFLHLCIPIIL